MHLIIGLFLSATLPGIIYAEFCSKEEHQKCVSLADPLLKDPQLIFPDNMKDIDNVCRTWSGFVECIRKYIEKCFSKQRKEQFNSAVEIPIASVHQMCTVSTYQAEYLKYASCIKATVIELEHCGNQYAALVNEVSRSDVTKANLCCAHHHFRVCVIMETKKRCDGNQIEGTAAKFARQNLDKALSFLHDQCLNYIPSSGSCTSSSKDSVGLASVSPAGEITNLIKAQSRPNHRSSSSEIFSGKTTEFHRHAHPKNSKSNGRTLLHPTTGSESRETIGESESSTPYVSMNSPLETTEAFNSTDEENVLLESTHTRTMVNDEQSAIVVTQRSPNYGRGISWTLPTEKSSSEIPAWATSTWLNSDQDAVTDDSWYPAAGTFGGNNIDEPNQQGLSKNGQIGLRTSFTCYVFIFVLICIV